MGDGAHLNVGAEGALRTVLGGEQSASMTDADFETMIREASLDGDFDYNNSSNAIARIVLEAYEQYPMLVDLSDEHVYLRNAEGEIDWENPIVLNVTLYEVVKRLYPQHQELFSDMTGFMWGWAMNAARKIIGQGPVPNPAIMTIRIPE